MRHLRTFARRRKRLLIALGGLAALWLVVLVVHARKGLPEGVSVAGPVHAGSRVEFLYDLTYRRDGETVTEQAIFDRILAMIDAADRFIVIDMFLFNDEHARDRPYRALTTQLADRLVARRMSRPELAVTFITDPINNFYGAYTTPQLRRMEEFGVDVVVTRLTRLRDSNPLYSAAWRMLPAWFGTAGPGFFPHPLSSTGRRVTGRAYLKLLNFKANHRKLIVTEDGCLVTSANPHDASSFHSNIAFHATGAVCQDILESERGIAAFSGRTIAAHQVDTVPPPVDASAEQSDRGSPGSTQPAGGAAVHQPGPSAGVGEVAAQYLTESRIREALIDDIDRTGAQDAIDIAVFYLSERRVVSALRAAAARGARIRVVLDPNKDAFGRQKGGVPNRQVALELQNIAVRWYDTHGEQFHTKLAVFRRGDSVTVIGGSANFTRRNLGDYNLEANLRVLALRDSPFAAAVHGYFDRIWNNEGGQYTLNFEEYHDDSLFKRILYRVQEFTGFCTY